MQYPLSLDITTQLEPYSLEVFITYGICSVVYKSWDSDTVGHYLWGWVKCLNPHFVFMVTFSCGCCFSCGACAKLLIPRTTVGDSKVRSGVKDGNPHNGVPSLWCRLSPHALMNNWQTSGFLRVWACVGFTSYTSAAEHAASSARLLLLSINICRWPQVQCMFIFIFAFVIIVYYFSYHG